MTAQKDTWAHRDRQVSAELERIRRRKPAVTAQVVALHERAAL